MTGTGAGAHPRSRTAVGALLAHSPQSGTLPAALRAGLSVAGPLSLLAALGRTDLALYATFGAFTAVYGRRPDGSADPRVQARLAVVLVCAVATGVAVSLIGAGPWPGVAAAAAWAALGAHLSERQAWRPPGPLFCVFAVGACSAVAVAGPAAAALAVGTAAGTALFALALTAASGPLVRRLAQRRRAAASATHPAAASAVPPRAAGAHAGPGSAAPRRRLQVVRCAAAVAVAGALGVATTSHHPYWAAVAAVAPLAAATLSSQLVRAAHRALGTLVGLGVAAVLLSLPLPVVALVAVAAVLQVLAELLVVRHYGAAMLVITPLALLMGQLARPLPVPALLADRGVETLVGVAVGVVVVLVTRPRARPASRMAV